MTNRISHANTLKHSRSFTLTKLAPFMSSGPGGVAVSHHILLLLVVSARRVQTSIGKACYLVCTNYCLHSRMSLYIIRYLLNMQWAMEGSMGVWMGRKQPIQRSCYDALVRLDNSTIRFLQSLLSRTAPNPQTCLIDG